MRIAAGLLLASLAPPATASATATSLKIVEVYTGPGPQYVMLQAYAPNQNDVRGQSLLVYDATGNVVQATTFPSPDGVSNAADQAAILVGTSNVAGTFAITVDLDMASAAMSPAGGKVCWDTTAIDCVAWGSYTGSPTGVGSPVAPAGIPSGKAIRRDLAISGDPTMLDATDDTDDSAADFDVVDPMPRNNVGQTGVTTTTHVPLTTTSTSATTTTQFGATTSTAPTTTTTLDCAPFGIFAARCVLAAVPPATCGTETFSRKLSRSITTARTLLDRAVAADGTKRGTRLVRSAALRMQKGSRLATTAGTKGKLTPTCAASVTALLDDARMRLLANVPH